MCETNEEVRARKERIVSDASNKSISLKELAEELLAPYNTRPTATDVSESLSDNQKHNNTTSAPNPVTTSSANTVNDALLENTSTPVAVPSTTVHTPQATGIHVHATKSTLNKNPQTSSALPATTTAPLSFVAMQKTRTAAVNKSPTTNNYTPISSNINSNSISTIKSTPPLPPHAVQQKTDVPDVPQLPVGPSLNPPAQIIPLAPKVQPIASNGTANSSQTSKFTPSPPVNSLPPTTLQISDLPLSTLSDLDDEYSGNLCKLSEEDSACLEVDATNTLSVPTQQHIMREKSTFETTKSTKIDKSCCEKCSECFLDRFRCAKKCCHDGVMLCGFFGLISCCICVYPCASVCCPEWLEDFRSQFESS